MFDDLNGAIDAVEHLRGHGHRDIHCITGPDDFGPAGRRMQGWAAALGRAGVSRRSRLHRVPFERMQAEDRLRELLSSAHHPSAVFATTDEQALATLRAAAGLGLRIPQDMALIGFDGVREALHGRIQLTTVSVPLRELAINALDALQTWNQGGQQVRVVLPATLVIGQTCGCR